MKKIVWPGLLAGLAALVLNFGINYLFMLLPAIRQDYANSALMRPWQDPLMSLFFLYSFVLGVIMAWAWNKSKNLFAGRRPCQRGLKFGLSFGLISVIPGMLATYSSFPLSFLTVLSWTVEGLISLIVMGAIFARLNK